MHAVIARVRKIRFFKSACKSGGKFHITLGHNTSMATAYFFGAKELAPATAEEEAQEPRFDPPTEPFKFGPRV